MRVDRFYDIQGGVKDVFDTSDFLLVDALCQIAGAGPDGDKTIKNTLSDNALLVLLLAAKAVRHNHMALPLDEANLRDLLARQLWGRPVDDGLGADDDVDEVNDGEDPLSTAVSFPDLRIQDIENGVRDIAELGGSVVERLEIGAIVDRTGSPVILTEVDGVPAFVAFRRFAHAEFVLGSAVVESGRSECAIQGVDVDRLLGIELVRHASPEAQLAVRGAITRRLSVLTGGPGRGKTTVIALLLIALHFEARASGGRFRVALAAPTAKAAVRMRVAIREQVARLGIEYQDIQSFIEFDERIGSVHRLLGIRPDSTKSLRTLDHDLVIIDEVSMLEFTLMAKLIEHCKQSNVLLVGDADQLASVEVGAALRDVVDAARSANLEHLVTELTVNYRSTKDIDNLASEIKKGSLDGVVAAIERAPDAVRWLERYSDATPEVLDWANALREAGRNGDGVEGLKLLAELCVLCATKNGVGSVQFWRDRVERMIPDVAGSPGRFRVGAPVLITENEQSNVRTVEERLANGDVGIVLLRPEGHDVFFGPADSPRSRQEARIGASETAWSMTIHKSQGSEYQRVIVSLPKSNSQLLSRELLYTAVTRAKERVTIVGSKKALEAALRESVPRASGLVERVSRLAALDHD
jgi:exodeoxyribonuclease V alpha subunit